MPHEEPMAMGTPQEESMSRGTPEQEPTAMGSSCGMFAPSVGLLRVLLVPGCSFGTGAISTSRLLA